METWRKPSSQAPWWTTQAHGGIAMDGGRRGVEFPTWMADRRQSCDLGAPRPASGNSANVRTKLGQVLKLSLRSPPKEVVGPALQAPRSCRVSSRRVPGCLERSAQVREISKDVGGEPATLSQLLILAFQALALASCLLVLMVVRRIRCFAMPFTLMRFFCHTVPLGHRHWLQQFCVAMLARVPPSACACRVSWLSAQ